MDAESLRHWHSNKLEIADGIVGRHGSLGEPDAEIILCCATSALAAYMWPGDSIDKVRFTQFLIDFSPSGIDLTKISIPVLVAKLEAANDRASAQALRSSFFPTSDQQLVDGDQIDQSESIITQLLPNIPVKYLRESSYAGIIYLDLRCGLIHEYRLPAYMKAFGISDRGDVPNYVNMTVEPDENTVRKVANDFGIGEDEARVAIAKIRRHLYFPYQYLRNALASSAKAAFDFWETSLTWTRPEPDRWWIKG